MANRDSGYPKVSGGNVAVDFVDGNFPLQTDDDRVTSPSYNATGGTTGSTVNGIPGIGADYGWSTTTDISSAKIQATDYVKNVNNVGTQYVVPSDNHVNTKVGWDNFPGSPATGGFNSANTLTATVTGASAAGGYVQYVTPNNYFSVGQSVTVTGLYNYVSAGSNQPMPTQYYAPTYTTASNFNLANQTIQGVTPTGFYVYNAATDATLTGVRGLAYVTVAASSATATVPTITGLTVKEAVRQLGLADFNIGTITYTTTGATLNNAGTIYSQAITGTQTVGSAVNVVVYRLATGEKPGTNAGTYTY